MDVFSITPSHIIEFLYCPRFTYFEYVLRIAQHEDKFFKVRRGREIHQKKARENMDYLRRRIGVVEKHIGQYLTNSHIRGEVDEVFLLMDGTMAPLDYKYAKFKDKIYETYRTQLYCYAWLIEDNFHRAVRKGFLVYTRSQNKLLEIDIRPEDQLHVRQCARAIRDIHCH